MKNTYSIAQRNALVEEYLPCINAMMQHERKTIRSARLDPEDVYQQLALRLIKAVGNYDPDKGDLKVHIMAQLRCELRDCLHPDLRSGMTDTPADFFGKVVSLDAYRSSVFRREAAMAA